MEHNDTKNSWVDLLNFNPYRKPIQSTRKGAIFQVHPYPTKINYKSIIPFILAHTKPGEIIYDCFAGTCSTGLAAAGCFEKDNSILKGLGRDPIEKAKWGGRKAICFDIGALPTFIGRTLIKPVNIQKLSSFFNEWIEKISANWGWLYETSDNDGNNGIIKYIYSTNVIYCERCKEQLPYIRLFVDFELGSFKHTAQCPKCNFSLNSKTVEPVLETIHDRLLERDIIQVKRIPYFVYGKTANKNWKRKATIQDIEAIDKIRKVFLPPTTRPISIMGNAENEKWGEMFRSGYHKGISHVHHFYSARNLLAIANLYHEAQEIPIEFRDVILLAISSYNVANSTLMTRFVFKKGNKNPVNTSAQPAALYIPNCQVEKNVFLGVRRKFKDILEALEEIALWNPSVEVQTVPAQDNGLASNSIDYVFTDPPFGGNIQYSELNYFSEAWLNSFTNNQHETIVSNHQNKGISDYESLLTDAFTENYRVLKPGKFMTVIFHNTRKALWNGLQRAIVGSGFEIVNTSLLDKTQTSFKQTTTQGAVKKDLIIVAWKPKLGTVTSKTCKCLEAKEFLTVTLKRKGIESQERTHDYLFGRFVGYILSSGGEMTIDAKEFRRILISIAEQKNGYWHLK